MSVQDNKLTKVTKTTYKQPQPNSICRLHVQTVNSDLVWLYQLMYQIKESLPLQSLIRSYTSNICYDCWALSFVRVTFQISRLWKMLVSEMISENPRSWKMLVTEMISGNHYGWSQRCLKMTYTSLVQIQITK